MSAYRLTVNGDHYVVMSDDHLAAWKTGVSEAVQHGGGFITITDTGGARTALLVTPHSTITVQEIELLHTPHHTDSPSRSQDVAAFYDY